MSKTHNEIEADAERELIHYFRRSGLRAYHIDIANIPGFHDVMAIGKNICLTEVKFHRPGKSAKLKDLMEPSQPVFMESIQDAGFERTFLCVFDGEDYNLYKTSDILMHSMDGDSYYDLHPIAQSVGPDAIANIIRSKCHGL